MKVTFALTFVSVGCFALQAQTSMAEENEQRREDKTLPGKGLAQHDFLFVGEHSRDPGPIMSIVRGGKVIWTYSIPMEDALGRPQYFSDAHMLLNGNIVFSRRTGASKITPDKRIVWNFDAPVDTEIYSVEPDGDDSVLMVINGDPAKVQRVNTETGKIEKEITIPTRVPKAHMQFRQVISTDNGNILVGRHDKSMISEFDWNGKELWSIAAKTPFSVQQLPNGNILTAGNGLSATEYNKRGEVIWEFGQQDVPGIKIYKIQSATRLANGNTIVANWCAHDLKADPASWDHTVQLIEVTPDKKVVWALRQWSNPDLGPATRIQLLDEPGIDNENGYLKYYPPNG